MTDLEVNFLLSQSILIDHGGIRCLVKIYLPKLFVVEKSHQFALLNYQIYNGAYRHCIVTLTRAKLSISLLILAQIEAGEHISLRIISRAPLINKSPRFHSFCT